jgi:hypothetical protein
MVNAKHHPALNQLVAELGDDGRLAIELPDGRLVEGEARAGEELQVRFYSLLRPARAIEGPFAQAISAHLGAPGPSPTAVPPWTAARRVR